MANKYIISLETETSNGNKLFWNSLKEVPNISFYHRLTNTWLIVDHSERLDETQISEILFEAYPNTRFLVSKVKVLGWKTRNKSEAVDWLFNSWKD